ncbi:MAG TPA: hypothetical protein VHZ95_03795, partial [Polyangiales bacterium]|nr:hypothetical protein [Polyangiales bacterium]
GLGYTFDPGPATDGVTGPAWLLPGLLAVRIGLDPIAIAKALGLLGALVATGLMSIRLRARSGGSISVMLASLLTIVSPTLACSAIAGLEAGAAALFVAIACVSVLARPAPRPVALGMSLFVLAWLRPELAFAGLVLMIAVAARSGGARAWPAFALGLAGVISVATFRFVMFGELLPLALAAKQGSLADGLEYCSRALVVTTGGFGLVLVFFAMRFGRSDDRWLGAALIAHVVAVFLAGGDWMPGFRLFAPVLPLYIALAAIGCRQAALRSRGLRYVALICLFVACVVPLLDLATRLPEMRAAGRSRERARALVAKLHKQTHRVALVDIGYLGYASGCDVIDLAGITDPEIARLPGGHLDKHIDGSLLRRRDPDALVLHSITPPMAAADGRLIGLRGYPVELRVAQSAWVQREFRVAALLHYAPDYYYVLLLRRTPPR